MGIEDASGLWIFFWFTKKKINETRSGGKTKPHNYSFMYGVGIILHGEAGVPSAALVLPHPCKPKSSQLVYPN